MLTRNRHEPFRWQATPPFVMIAVFSNVKTDSIRLDRSMICNPAPADMFVVLNAAAPLSLPVVARHENKVLVRRWHRKLHYYHGPDPRRDSFVSCIFWRAPSTTCPAHLGFRIIRVTPNSSPLLASGCGDSCETVSCRRMMMCSL